MSMQHHQGGSFSGLAKRWLKDQLHFHTSSNRVMRSMPEPGTRDSTALAERSQGWDQTLASIEKRQAEQAVQRVESRLVERPTFADATVSLIFRGAVKGTLKAEIPARIEWPADDDIFATIDLESLEPMTVGDREFHSLRIAVPANDALTGKPINLAKSVERHWRYWDPLNAQVRLDSSDDAFYWSADFGSAHFWPEPGLHAVQLIMPIENALGERVSIDGSIRFQMS